MYYIFAKEMVDSFGDEGKKGVWSGQLGTMGKQEVSDLEKGTRGWGSRST
jgi:hypothetical protein